MTLEEVREVLLVSGVGIYFIHWAGVGGSVAAVGMNADGLPWLAPTNWAEFTIRERHRLENIWAAVDRMEFIMNQQMELTRRRMSR